MSSTTPFRPEAVAAHRERRSQDHVPARRRADPRVLLVLPVVIAALVAVAFLPVPASVDVRVAVGADHVVSPNRVLLDVVGDGRSSAVWRRGTVQRPVTLVRSGDAVEVIGGAPTGGAAPDRSVSGRGVLRIGTAAVPLFRFLSAADGRSE